MRIVFLDIDGVLNTYSTKIKVAGYNFVEDYLVKNLKILIEESNKIDKTEIVLISSWRLNYKVKPEFQKGHEELYYALVDKFKEYDLSIYGSTISGPKSPVPNEPFFAGRHLEIEQYLIDNTEKDNITSWVILDDEYYQYSKYLCKDYPGYEKSCYCRLVNTSNVALQDFKVKEALAILNATKEELDADKFHNVIIDYDVVLNNMTEDNNKLNDILYNIVKTISNRYIYINTLYDPEKYTEQDIISTYRNTNSYHYISTNCLITEERLSLYHITKDTNLNIVLSSMFDYL